jgi:predicted nucleic acid-binding protein
VRAQGAAIVPALWHVEIANGLGMAERRNRLSRADVERALGLARTLPLDLDEQTPSDAVEAVLRLMNSPAHRVGRGYLELAMRHRLPLATSDSELRRAARSVRGGLL